MPGSTPVVKTITGQHIAKAVHYSKWERAHDAALWCHGEVVVKPTLALAAAVFHVSVPLVVEAGHQLVEHRKLHTNGNGTSITVLSDAVIENMVAEIGIERVWRVAREVDATRATPSGGGGRVMTREQEPLSWWIGLDAACRLGQRPRRQLRRHLP